MLTIYIGRLLEQRFAGRRDRLGAKISLEEIFAHRFSLKKIGHMQKLRARAPHFMCKSSPIYFAYHRQRCRIFVKAKRLKSGLFSFCVSAAALASEVCKRAAVL